MGVTRARTPVLFAAASLLLAAVCALRDARAQGFWEAARNPALHGLARRLTAAQFRLACSEAARIELPPPLRERVLANCGAASPDEQLAQAHAQFAALVRDAPEHVAALWGLSQTLEQQRRYDAAQAVLARARERAGDAPELASILFAQGANFTRLERHAEAREAYAQYLALPLGNRARGVGLCNLAETLGTLGELERAIRTYEDCVAALPDDAIGLWGLAVVSDRAGREDDALRAARDALALDPELRKVDGPDVFYVPAHEVHYYLGLAREAQARWSEARGEWQLFLDAAGPSGAWADRARAHIARLDARAAASARRTPSAPGARPTRGARPGG